MFERIISASASAFVAGVILAVCVILLPYILAWTI